MVIRPWGYGIWERLQAELDLRIKEAGAENAYFPLLIPESYLQREAEHVEGFSPELAVVTHAGGKQLEEPAVIRPTSETVIDSFFAKWIKSHRDLPLLINQWANVVRWELRTRLFLRTTEFLWQEGHTAHSTEEEARLYALRILTDVYSTTMQDVASIPVLLGFKTDRERFAGAVRTWTCEAMMGDGKALQMGTSHELGQNFSKVFGIQFADETGSLQNVWQTSWGATSRLIGALIMVHGDDFGLRLPPALAPSQVVVLIVREEEGVRRAAQTVVEDLKAVGLRVRLDDRTGTGFGRRSIDWELKGVPVRVEMGPRELAENKAVVVSRHQRSKEAVPLGGLVDLVVKTLSAASDLLREEALAFRSSHTVEAKSLAEALEAGTTGFAKIPWSELGPDGEAKLAAESLSVRCLQRMDGGIPLEGNGQDGDLLAVVGRSY